ncbi:MAG: putative bifunctional diguanylate cyclase/phosphodiesterase [Microcoleaceae cyanobacterium]
MNDSGSATYPKVDILIVDDTPANLRLLSQMLSDQGYKVRQAINGKMAVTAAITSPPALILLDVLMPDLSGYDVCAQLKADQATAAIPIIFLSALDDVLDKVKAFEIGGADYVTKPFELEEILVRVKNQLALQAGKQRLQELHDQLERRVEQRSAKLELANQRLMQMALHDSLTQLPNRRLFLQRLHQAIDRLQGQPKQQLAVLSLDCDRFKAVNDSLGHVIGDELLIAMSQTLSALLEPDQVVARWGGDEFNILLRGANVSDIAIQVADQILEKLAQPFQLENHKVFVNASIGIAFWHSTYQNPEHLLRDADIALYQAKAMGKGQHRVFDPNLHMATVNVLALETELHRAINQQEFVVHYQPIVSLLTAEVTGVEALVRWSHPTQGILYPEAFLSSAEETGLIVPLGNWILETACRQIKTWQTNCPHLEDLFVSVNLSTRQFAQADLLQQIDQILAVTHLSPRSLQLEMTEGVMMNNLALSAPILQELVQRKIKLGIDDFGTGYSSLSCLDSLPVSTLKIDQSFIETMDRIPQRSDLVPVIITIARTMKMNTIAEGIETPEQLGQLQQLGCDFGQGYLFSKPLSADAIFALLQTQPRWSLNGEDLSCISSLS